MIPQYYSDIHTQRDAQLFIERNIESGFTVMTTYGLARDTYNTTTNKDIRNGARLVLAEMDRQRKANEPLTRFGLAVLLVIVGFVILMAVYVIG